ncbi:galactose oxidase-like domain-containing protein [Enhygromyxa salina]|uniref:galactose oxidase-like domain-containing protein n=1 Tax=Enhygromyxa salina TaxID=215803 RepID=UPI0013FD03EB|nr:galactose oxidase-like domain-containing protein [Enhygromyxa salina]
MKTSVDQGQLFVPLTVLGADANSVTVRAPAPPREATPGYYMLFVLSENGVPSVAPYVRIQQPCRAS